jgi:hypothetical protein
MKKLLTLAAAVAVLSQGQAVAQEKKTGQSDTPKARLESTTKQKRPGPDVKAKREVVIGTVKEYEAGKNITVVGPKGKDYSFDLEGRVAVKGTISPGETVKVEYTKSNGASRVVIVSPWNEPASSNERF